MAGDEGGAGAAAAAGAPTKKRGSAGAGGGQKKKARVGAVDMVGDEDASAAKEPNWTPEGDLDEGDVEGESARVPKAPKWAPEEAEQMMSWIKELEADGV